MAVKLFKNFYIECNAAGRDNLALLPTNMIYKKWPSEYLSKVQKLRCDTLKKLELDY